MLVGELSKHLGLPGAKLQQTHVQSLNLWLLQVDAGELHLNAQQIGYFWQHLPYWAFAWAGGRVLAQFILDHPECVTGKTVLDFGCGSGLVGIAAAKAGAREVWIADLDPYAIQAAQVNAALNNVTLLCADAKQGWPNVDLLLASDVLYDISSSADLRTLMLTIPDWLLAEQEQVAPNWVALHSVWQTTTSTLPVIGDFDEAITVNVYSRCNKPQ